MALGSVPTTTAPKRAVAGNDAATRRELALLPGVPRKLLLIPLVALYIVVPMIASDYWATILALAGLTAFGAMGLNLLSGYTGQPSLGQAFFIGLGAFTAGYLGRATNADPAGLGQPFLVYFLAAGVIGAIIGAIVGLPALRLRGNYLAVVTLGLVFVGIWLFAQIDTLTGVNLTGGSRGAPMPQTAQLFGIDFTSIGGLGRNQSLLYLFWGLVAVLTVFIANVVRRRPGRALQAVRDRDVAAEVAGVSNVRYKIGAFVVSSAIATMGGVLFGIWATYVTPDQTNLGILLSIQYLAVVVIGGIGTVYGPILGALIVIGLEPVLKYFAKYVPGVTDTPNAGGIFTGTLAQIIYGVLIVVFLILEPRGLVGIGRRVAARLRRIRSTPAPGSASR
ncbi:MAG: branched-chain amino acid ABC transporter permease [Acidimicrobiia bacterium]